MICQANSKEGDTHSTQRNGFLLWLNGLIKFNDRKLVRAVCRLHAVKLVQVSERNSLYLVQMVYDNACYDEKASTLAYRKDSCKA